MCIFVIICNLEEKYMIWYKHKTSKEYIEYKFAVYLNNCHLDPAVRKICHKTSKPPLVAISNTK